MVVVGSSVFFPGDDLPPGLERLVASRLDLAGHPGDPFDVVADL